MLGWPLRCVKTRSCRNGQVSGWGIGTVLMDQEWTRKSGAETGEVSPSSPNLYQDRQG